jgi:hypothetical protein
MPPKRFEGCHSIQFAAQKERARREKGESKESMSKRVIRYRNSLLSYPPYELMLLVRTMIIELIGV